MIKVGQAIDLISDANIGLDATDYEDVSKKGSVIVKDYGELNLVNPVKGTYTVVYEVTDDDGNTTTKEIIVTVISKDTPIIIEENKTIEVGDKFDSLEDVKDNNINENPKIGDTSLIGYIGSLASSIGLLGLLRVNRKKHKR